VNDPASLGIDEITIALPTSAPTHCQVFMHEASSKLFTKMSIAAGESSVLKIASKKAAEYQNELRRMRVSCVDLHTDEFFSVDMVLSVAPTFGGLNGNDVRDLTNKHVTEITYTTTADNLACSIPSGITTLLAATSSDKIAEPAMKDLLLTNANHLKSLSVTVHSAVGHAWTNILSTGAINVVSNDKTLVLSCIEKAAGDCSEASFLTLIKSATIETQGNCAENDLLDTTGSVSVTVTDDKYTSHCSNTFAVISPPATYMLETAKEQTCIPCACGSYQSLAGQTSCISCEAGTYGDSALAKDSSSHCAVCAAGTWGSESAQCDTCANDCPAGTKGVDASAHYGTDLKALFSDKLTACVECPCGQYQPAPGSASCIECHAGTVGIDGQGKTLVAGFGSLYTEPGHCAQCAAGTYNFKTHTGICATTKDCENGCPAGKYGDSKYLDDSAFVGSASTDAEHCDDCPAGWAQGDRGQQECDKCADGKFSVAGSNECFSCEYDYSYSACSGSCATCDSSGNPLSTPTKSRTAILKTDGYSVAKMAAATEQCADGFSLPDVECNTRCCPNAPQCKNLHCTFAEHGSGAYSVQVSHHNDEGSNALHKCHLLEDGFGGKECVCECWSEAGEVEDTIFRL